VAAAARQRDTDTIRALVGEAERRGLAAGELLAVAERHWPGPPLGRRARHAGSRWAASSVRWTWGTGRAAGPRSSSGSVRGDRAVELGRGSRSARGA